MNENYINLENLISYMGDQWNNDYEGKAATVLIPASSAILRKLFKDRGFDLNECLENGEVELINIQVALYEVVSSALKAAESDLPDASQFSQNMDGMGFSFSGVAGTNLFFKQSILDNILPKGIVVSKIEFLKGF